MFIKAVKLFLKLELHILDLAEMKNDLVYLFQIPGTRSRRSRDSTSSSNRKSEGDDQAKDKGANISNKVS